MIKNLHFIKMITVTGINRNVNNENHFFLQICFCMVWFLCGVKNRYKFCPKIMIADKIWWKYISWFTLHIYYLKFYCNQCVAHYEYIVREFIDLMSLPSLLNKKI